MAKPQPAKEAKTMLRSTSVRLPVDLLRAAKVHGATHDVSLQEMITEGLSTYLKAAARVRGRKEA
jgi:hypothetical protein